MPSAKYPEADPLSVKKPVGSATARQTRRKPGRPKSGATIAGEDPRTRLLRFATQIFSQYGYDAVSTGDVARAADLSQPMVHYHFGSKELLWKAAMTELMRDLGRRYPNNAVELKDLDAISRLKVVTRRFIMMSAGIPPCRRSSCTKALRQATGCAGWSIHM